MTTGKFKVMEKEWISIKDKLPEDNQNVLVYSEGFRGEYFIAKYRTRVNIFVDESEDMVLRPSHWQPLAPPVN